MRHSSKVRRTAIVAAAFLGPVLGLAGAAHAEIKLNANDKSQIGRCVGYMLLGPKYEGLEFKGEGFVCKPVTASVVADKLVVTGQLSHQLKLRDDDQVNFTFEIMRDGTITKSEVKVVDGGLVKVVNWLKDNDVASAIINHIPHGDTALDIAEWVTEKAAKKLDNSWTGYADLIVLSLEAKVSFGLANVGKPHVESYFIDKPGGDIGKSTINKNQNYGGLTPQEKYPSTFVQACDGICRDNNQCTSSTYIITTHVCILKNEKAASGTLYDRGVTMQKIIAQPPVTLTPHKFPVGK